MQASLLFVVLGALGTLLAVVAGWVVYTATRTTNQYVRLVGTAPRGTVLHATPTTMVVLPRTGPAVYLATPFVAHGGPDAQRTATRFALAGATGVL